MSEVCEGYCPLVEGSVPCLGEERENPSKIRRYRGLSHDVIEDPPAAIENLVLYSQREHPDMGMRTILKWCDQSF